MTNKIAEPELTFKNPVDIALAIESASKHEVDMKSESTPSRVNRAFARDKKTKTARGNPEFTRCGDKYGSSSCKFLNVMFTLRKKGHLASVS